MAVTLASLKVKLFTDGADKAQIVEMAKQAHIAGFTTNPSLLKKAGVKDYESYARELVELVRDKGDFSVGVAAFPELHPRSGGRAGEDRRHLAAKLELADFAITQFFADADDYGRLRSLFGKSNCLIAPNFAIGAVLMMRFAEIAAPFFETAEIIAGELGMGSPATDMRLLEAHNRFDGMHRYAFLFPWKWPRLWNPFRPSWGEPFSEIAERMSSIIAAQRDAHPGGAIVLVSHQAPIWIARQAFERPGVPWLAPVRCTPASITTLRFDGPRYVGHDYWAPHPA